MIESSKSVRFDPKTTGGLKIINTPKDFTKHNTKNTAWVSLALILKAIMLYVLTCKDVHTSVCFSVYWGWVELHHKSQLAL